jgi:hypothetical protein
MYVTISAGDLVIPDEQWTYTLWFYIFIKLFKWIAPWNSCSFKSSELLSDIGKFNISMLCLQ